MQEFPRKFTLVRDQIIKCPHNFKKATTFHVISPVSSPYNRGGQLISIRVHMKALNCVREPSADGLVKLSLTKNDQRHDSLQLLRINFFSETM